MHPMFQIPNLTGKLRHAHVVLSNLGPQVNLKIRWVPERWKVAQVDGVLRIISSCENSRRAQEPRLTTTRRGSSRQRGRRRPAKHGKCKARGLFRRERRRKPTPFWVVRTG
jgi:hypothetical protein